MGSTDADGGESSGGPSGYVLLGVAVLLSLVVAVHLAGIEYLRSKGC